LNEYTLDLKNLLRLAFSQPLTWLAGEPQEDTPVHWAAISEEEILPGDLLLLAGERGDHESLAEAGQRGAAAVILLGKPQVDLGEADFPSGLPVAVVGGESDLRAAQRLLLSMIINQRGALMERGVRIHTQLSQLATAGGGLDGLAAGIASISGRGVLVQDKRLNVVAHSPSATLSGIWEEVLASIIAPGFLPLDLRDRKQAGRQAPVLEQKIPGDLMRLITPIVVGEVARGYLSLVGLEGELDILDRLILEQGALVCAVEMARNKAVREAEKRLKGDLLNALLQDNLSPRDAQLWTQAMALDLDQAHVALRFAWDSPAAPSRRRLETIVNGEIARQGLAVATSPMGSEVVCFCQVPSGAARPALALAFGQAVSSQGEQEYPNAVIRCGVGIPAKELGQWRISFRQAGQALEMARRLGERAPLYFADLSIYRLLLQLEHSPELVAFQEETLGALLAHESSDELITTLEAYFTHNGNLSQAAEALYIHRNTLVYRLERIASITDLDLDNPETRLAIQLALHIQRMIGAKRG
jgi:purine catabolism regulator